MYSQNVVSEPTEHARVIPFASPNEALKAWERIPADLQAEIEAKYKTEPFADEQLEKAKAECLLEMLEKNGKAMIRSLSNITIEKVLWQWLHHVPIGKITVFGGHGGLGKTLITYDLAARVSTGFPMPDNSPVEKGDTLIISAEDDASDTIAPRLQAAKADLSRVYVADGFQVTTEDKDGNDKTTVQQYTMHNLDFIRSTHAQIKAAGGDLKLVIIDPWTSFTGHSDYNKDTDVRSFLIPLAKLAAELKFAVILVAHLNKSSKSAVENRISGSLGLRNTARSVFMINRDEKDRDRMLFLHEKSNLSRLQDTLAYTIRETEDEVPYIEWDTEPVNITAQEAFEDRKTITPERVDILEYLKENGPAKTGEIAEAVGQSQPACSKMLGKLLKKGLVESVKTGTYQLPSSTITTPIEHISGYKGYKGYSSDDNYNRYNHYNHPEDGYSFTDINTDPPTDPMVKHEDELEIF